MTWVAWVLGAAAAGLLAVGVALLVAVVRDGRTASARARGTVVGHQAAEDDDATWFAPVVEFPAGDRTGRVVGAFLRDRRPKLPVGEQVWVYFPPGQPELARLRRYDDLGCAAVWAAAGLGLLAWAVRELLRAPG